MEYSKTDNSKQNEIDMLKQTLIGCTALLVVLTTNTAHSSSSLCSSQLPQLPEAVSNNAVASLTVKGVKYLVSFAGIDKGLSHKNIHARTFVFNGSTNSWTEQSAVPGKDGRLAATAVSVGELAYVFGGYTVAEDGTEISTPWVHSFNPVTSKFTELSHMPIPVDDAVAVVFEDRYIYLISGWHDLGNVNLVQRYDTELDIWVQATPIPGSSLFGHAGGIVGKKIVYCDGVLVKANPDKRRSFEASNECYIGTIDSEDKRRIDWRPIESHPGLPRYRMAATGVESLNSILFIGGSENPYNFNGMGYNRQPSEPKTGALLFNVETLEWQNFRQNKSPTMDHRGLVEFKNGWVTIGGMLAKQEVSNGVVSYSLKPKCK